MRTRSSFLRACPIGCILLLSVPCSAQYQGTGSVTQGLATTIDPDIHDCPNGRVPAIGAITATDNSTWTVPAEVRFTDDVFPFASVLYNPCTGATFATSNDALNALDGSDVVVIDPGGELFTGYVFADNYFELLINGTPVGKDDVPYTQFNSSIVRFRVQRPFTIAVLLVDWEEHLGIGTEANGGFTDHPGDGGMVAVFKDEQGNVVSITGTDWKAQVFYTAPIMDLACPQEIGSLRSSDDCSTQNSNDGSAYYGLHWPIPSDWAAAAYDDSDWPQARSFTNAEVGVNNKPAYTNFTDVFDDPAHDAVFIWSSNLILDNAVIVRHVVDAPSAVEAHGPISAPFTVYPDIQEGHFTLRLADSPRAEDIRSIRVLDPSGRSVRAWNGFRRDLDLGELAHGIYAIAIVYSGGTVTLNVCKQ